jgi:hypothetical protein
MHGPEPSGRVALSGPLPLPASEWPSGPPLYRGRPLPLPLDVRHSSGVAQPLPARPASPYPRRGSIRAAVLQHLRACEPATRTHAELASALGLTVTSVDFARWSLERAGLVRRVGFDESLPGRGHRPALRVRATIRSPTLNLHSGVSPLWTQQSVDPEYAPAADTTDGVCAELVTPNNPPVTSTPKGKGAFDHFDRVKSLLPFGKGPQTPSSNGSNFLR